MQLMDQDHFRRPEANRIERAFHASGDAGVRTSPAW
jgi:hypothetical protein